MIRFGFRNYETSGVLYKPHLAHCSTHLTPPQPFEPQKHLPEAGDFKPITRHLLLFR
ncbi:hypothetical protein HanXRQr2_Chr09g0368171 [Helianthus annuus]|uniref:Uncharacterized protein n=1 Tax=Helianthus annuus TaxID=4232 RepID=A0A9K3N7F5_HELAN|nr:hypothetical protein HanXRQr2_Chr09g0368171 [Helianthus annuus]KAJ0891493.1 hypothetical protein HanPSC8_Chr09g0354531 [Helianthus annuus]